MRHQRWAARRPRLIQPLAPVVALLALFVAACGSSAHATQPALMPTPTATEDDSLAWKFATATAQSWTPTPIPDAAQYAPIAGAHPHWHALSLPADFGFAYHQSWLGVSTENGADAYSCSQSGPNTPVETVKSTNAGASWFRVADLAQGWDGCMNITVDALNPQIVVMSGGSGAAYTRDGGQTWHVSSAAPLTGLRALATVGSRAYALFRNTSGDALGVSVNGLASWQDITGPLAGQGISAFWANPTTGALLAETMSGYPAAPMLWRSSDGGAHWSSSVVPFTSGDAMVAKAPVGSSPWTLCASVAGGAQPGIACSTDSGAHWKTLPLLADAGLRGYGVVGVADDGAALALGMADTGSSLYRLAPGATRWQALGPTPPTTGALLYAHVSGGTGIFWSLPNVRGGGAGDANPSDVYTATYPY